MQTGFAYGWNVWNGWNEQQLLVPKVPIVPVVPMGEIEDGLITYRNPRDA
jgi:hypothetical protein